MFLLCESVAANENSSASRPSLAAVPNHGVREHLIFVVRTIEFGGLEKHLLDLVARLDERVSCTILCYGVDFYSSRLSGRPHVAVCSRNSRSSGAFFSMLFTFMQLRPSSVIFVKGSMGDFGLAGCVAARCAGIRRVIAIEHLVADPMPAPVSASGISGYFRRYLGWRAREVSLRRLQSRLLLRTICVSEGVRNRLVADYGYPPSSTVTVLNGTDLKHFRPSEADERARIRQSLGLSSEEIVIVCAARLSERKRIDLLLESLARLPGGVPPWKCLILGSGDRESDLKALSAKLGLVEAVRFIGFVADVRPFMSIGDVYVSPSEKEGFGLTLVEAMACGLPCVATNIEGHNEIVVDGDTGVLVPSGSATHLADALHRLLIHDKERKRMGVNARRRVEEHFNLETSMSKIKELIVRTNEQSKEL